VDPPRVVSVYFLPRKYPCLTLYFQAQDRLEENTCWLVAVRNREGAGGPIEAGIRLESSNGTV